ncbi:helix-turn-helix transcriptional regulator [Parvularcula sp. LCG005]|uniref:helix-turn-helix transcriptional regulator n=1 Tax=Parvularcula sp. LCG005 TaxID=3078805 RepID=UPI002943515C|nr:helix-turn-helix transcriptional regulator [Parvularcula sp. LCG005]WOI54020.1 helix-turn-helix transcriptional regulator [Parvularcula sp. LCG005]
MGKTMEPNDFKKWRKTLGFSQKDAADALGLKRRMIQYYERGERDGDKVKIPLTVALACYALTQGVVNYRGPSKKIDRSGPVSETDEPIAIPEPENAQDDPDSPHGLGTLAAE